MLWLFARLLSSLSQRLIQHMMHHSLTSVVLHDCTTACWCWNDAMAINYAIHIWWNHKYNKTNLVASHIDPCDSYQELSSQVTLKTISVSATVVSPRCPASKDSYASLPILRPTIELSTRNLFRRICGTRVVGVAHLVIDPECHIKVGPVLDNEI